MNPDIKALWLEALRSGLYRQGRGRLRRSRNNTFCCLGVLCDVIAPKDWKNEKHQGFTNLPSVQIGIQAGLAGIEIRKLARLNDSDRVDFPEIADWIEQNL